MTYPKVDFLSDDATQEGAATRPQGVAASPKFPEIEDRVPAIGGGEPREDHRVDREAVPPLRLPDQKRGLHLLLPLTITAI